VGVDPRQSLFGEDYHRKTSEASKNPRSDASSAW
jgi:hypothetical protein